MRQNSTSALRERIGTIVSAARKAAGMSQQELSEKSGVDRGNIANLERGTYNASIDILEKVLKALDLNVTIS